MANPREKEFLGQGLAFPLQLNARGGLALVAGARDIEQAIRIILETQPGERVMRPEFGCRAKELLFAPRNAATEGRLVEYVTEALRYWEPRIEVLNVAARLSVDPDGAWLVEISYRIKDTHDERSLVYPFFIGEEA